MAGWTTVPPPCHHHFPIDAVTGPASGHTVVCMEEKLRWPQQHWLGLCFTSVFPPAEFLGLVPSWCRSARDLPLVCSVLL